MSAEDNVGVAGSDGEPIPEGATVEGVKTLPPETVADSQSM